MNNKIFYIETENGTLWYTEVDGKLFDSNSRGFVFNSLHFPENMCKGDLKEFNLDVLSDNLNICETNSVVLNEK
jgi:hypothetical protein